MLERLTHKADGRQGLGTYMSPAGMWAFSLGTSIGWGSVVITGSTYLSQAGPVGSVLGMVLGLVIMLVVARSYAYMVERHPSAGGIYAFARDVFGYDHGVLAAWFVGLTYMAVLWANATSLPLFARYFIGDVFKWGYLYQLFGYDVYLGEALLSVVAVLLAGLFSMGNKRAVQAAMVGMGVLYTAGITVTFGSAMLGHGASAFSYEPLFVPGSSPMGQVIRIACLSSWAFIGFESVSHSADEFSFPAKKMAGILTVTLIITTVLYVFITLLSVTAYPDRYPTWLAYMTDLGSCSGIEGIPAFYAAGRYVGPMGVQIMIASLFALIVTSLFGNTVALSRLLYALAADRVISPRMGAVNEYGTPVGAILFIMAVSSAAPFLGRTTIGWIVDVTTLGATFVYGIVSVCAYKEGRDQGIDRERICGLVGMVIMGAFALYLLLPNFLAGKTMATESYLLFSAWAVMGFLFFQRLLIRDEERRFGKSIISWAALLVLVLFASLAWIGEIIDDATTTTAQTIHEYLVDTTAITAADQTFVDQAMVQLSGGIARSLFVLAAMFIFTVSIMLSNFAIMRRREEESQRQLGDVRATANRDPLTGVKSKLAYAAKESALNAEIQGDTLEELAVVVCDVNDLKLVNDTKGHKAGDEYIRSASAMICHLFKHSPVYRIGGDEFVVLLQGADYAARVELMAQLDAQSEAHQQSGEVVVAAGMAVYERGSDTRLQMVFERADAFMYERKVALKGAERVR